LGARSRPLSRFCVTAALSVGLLITPGAAQATPTGNPVAWGCEGIGAWGQCTVPLGLTSATAIAAGYYSGLALKSDGTVVAWGCGMLGVQGACNVPSDLSGVTRIAAGNNHALALKGDGTVVAWGSSCADVYTNFGQCDVPNGLSGVTAIAAGYAHSLAVKADGTVVAWGCGTASGMSADYGQCDVPANLSGVTAVAASYAHSLALKDDGTVVAWGCKGLGGTNVGQCTVPGGLSGVTAISAGTSDSLALKDDGTVVAWGCAAPSDVGQCNVPNDLSGVTAIAASQWHSLALKDDGTVVAWGCGAPTDYGQCTVPNGLSRVAAIAAGPFHSVSLVDRSQTITFGSLANKTHGDPDFSVSATASSGLAVSFAASGNCTVSGTTVHLTRAGSCTITASQQGDANFNPATDVSQSFAIAKAGQSISLGPLANKTHGDPDFSVSATASSGLAVSFAASGNCTVSGTTVHLTGAGFCRITASQPGDANYNPALDVSHSIAIAKAGQSIAFAPLANKTYGSPDFRVSATASSGLAVFFAGSGKCSVSGTRVHLTGIGLCTVTASQAGDANFNPAAAVSRTFSIKAVPCTVPNVVGKRLATAKRTIAKSHCRTGKVGYAYSRKRKKGLVVSQSRRAGRVLPANSRINLTVSRGRKR
jgi:hypothetical protein